MQGHNYSKFHSLDVGPPLCWGYSYWKSSSWSKGKRWTQHYIIIRNKYEVILHLKYLPKGCDILLLQIFSISQKQFLFFIEFGYFIICDFSPIRGSSVLGKPVKYWYFTACYVHFWSGVICLGVPTLQDVNYFYYFIHI